jgi:predicted metal-dependent phosphoesterase TrpH
MGRADLHVHTNEGDGLDRVPSIFDWVQDRTQLDVLAITEHDDLGVALRAHEVWAKRHRSFDFVPGVEVTTLEGHLIALFVETPVPSLRRIEETIEAVHRQGGLCVVPHPMSWLTRSVGPGTLNRLASHGDGAWPDGMEVATSSPTSRLFLAKARALNADRYHLPGVGASDAHFAAAVGSAWTVFEGETAADLRRSILQGKVSGEAGAFPSLRSVGLARALTLPLMGLRATPKKVGWRRTVWSFFGRYHLPTSRAAIIAAGGRQRLSHTAMPTNIEPRPQASSRGQSR